MRFVQDITMLHKNGMLARRLVLTALMLIVMSVTMMAEGQMIRVKITGNCTWSLKVDGTEVPATSFDADGVANVSGKEGKSATITITPTDASYIVKDFRINELAILSRADSPGLNLLGLIEWTQDGSSYSFTMPASDDQGVFITASIVANNGYSGIYYIGSNTWVANSKNNFYLCPTEEWIYYQDEETNYTSTDNGQPFLTTYRHRAGTAGAVASKAVWIIEKAPSSEYYYIKHAIDNKFITYNGPISTTSSYGVNRLRFHLEENKTDNALFEINTIGNSGAVTFAAVGAFEYMFTDKGKLQNCKYLNLSSNDTNTLQGSDGKKDGPTGYKNVGATIGIWYETGASSQWYLEQAVVDPPTIINNFDGTITIVSETDAAIYYTLDGSTPTTSTTNTGTTSVNVTLSENIQVIKAIAKGASDDFPSFVSIYELPVCEKPVITISGDNVTISAPGASVYYTTDDTEATTASTLYEGPFSLGSAPAIRAISAKPGYYKSEEAYYYAQKTIHSSSEITDMNRDYLLASDFSIDTNGSIGTAENPFKGKIDGNMVTISGLTYSFIGYARGATIKNIILDNVTVSGGINAGAICNEATGETRIYNCGVLGGSISGSGNVGGIVGQISGTSRVVNCYNFATISGGMWAGGIVGYNAEMTRVSNIKTMVMNCMFYGNITSGTNISPIYGGTIIDNNPANEGLNNFNFFRENATISATVYNCALAMEEKYLNRFEFYRHLLNSNRELAAWYATGSADEAFTKMAKWVLDKSVAEYPILKPYAYYPSVINYDPSQAPETPETQKSLSVTLSGDGITTTSLSLPIKDMDPEHYNYNYHKVQLPYFNDVGEGNYTNNKVVTGWKIISITGSSDSPSFFTKDATALAYNFADPDCADKDLFSTSGRVFSQGAYYDVPRGVSAITIEPYWADAVYLSDPYYDLTGYAGTNHVTAMGTRFRNDESYEINGNSQKIYTNMDSAVEKVGTGGTVYDHAIVLVGNYHQVNPPSAGNKLFTLMSADLNADNEPDYSLIYYHSARKSVCPIRFDFVNIPSVNMAQKVNGVGTINSVGIFKPKGWFEITNTCLIKFGQFEYDYCSSAAPLILLGGIYEQFVSSRDGAGAKTDYIHLGSNAWFKVFSNGCHVAVTNKTKHIPISVTGGEYEKFYLSGYYSPNVSPNADNAKCYINGGKFVEVAGAGQELINGSVTWQVSNAYINNFYGGGINAAKAITGDIYVTLKGGYIGTYCGGPKFGNMATNKKVTTIAKNTHFGTFFGAGFGGTSYYKDKISDETYRGNIKTPYNTNQWNTWANSYVRGKYDATKGIATDYEYEFFEGTEDFTVARLYVNYATFSMAKTNDVNSTLTDCIVDHNFYGGGNLGKVTGTATSIINGKSEIGGSVYGAGFSVKIPSLYRCF